MANKFSYPRFPRKLTEEKRVERRENRQRTQTFINRKLLWKTCRTRVASSSDQYVTGVRKGAHRARQRPPLNSTRRKRRRIGKARRRRRESTTTKSRPRKHFLKVERSKRYKMSLIIGLYRPFRVNPNAPLATHTRQMRGSRVNGLYNDFRSISGKRFFGFSLERLFLPETN